MPVVTRSQAKRPFEEMNQEPQPQPESLNQTSEATSPIVTGTKQKKIKPNVDLDLGHGSQPAPLSSAPVQFGTNIGGNPFGKYDFLKLIGRIASHESLATLKALTNDHYRVLQPIHLKTAEKEILIQNEKEIGGPAATTQKNVIKCSTKVGETEKIITALNWKPELAPAFNKLEYGSMFFLGLRPPVRNTRLQANFGISFLSTLIEQLNPYITTVKVNSLDNAQGITEPAGATYAEFWNQLPALRVLKISYKPNPRFSLAQLNIMLQALQPNIQVIFDVSDSTSIDNLAVLMTTLESYPEKVKVNLNNLESGRQESLDRIVTICNRRRAQLENVNLRICMTGQNFPNNEMFVSSLVQLGPIITDFTIHNNARKKDANYNDLGGNIEWPKLRSLFLDRYNKPVHILKKCPQLEKLRLGVNQRACIFHDPKKTDKEAVKEYFGNLHHLRKLTFGTPWRSGERKLDYKLHDGNALEEFMKELLPQEVKIEYL